MKIVLRLMTQNVTELAITYEGTVVEIQQPIKLIQAEPRVLDEENRTMSFL
jgi:hypothetical protein